MICSISNCNNIAKEEIKLETGEIKGFCKKNYYHTISGKFSYFKADKKYKQTEKGKKAVKRIRKNKEKWKIYYSNLTKEQKKARNKRAYANISPESLAKIKFQTKELRLAIKLNGLLEREYYEFREKLIQERGNKCELCYFSVFIILKSKEAKEKRLILHHKKHYHPNYKLLIEKPNCLILCYKHHRIVHTTKNQFYIPNN